MTNIAPRAAATAASAAMTIVRRSITQALSIMNGTSVMTALVALAVERAEALARAHAMVTAWNSFLLRGQAAHFDELWLLAGDRHLEKRRARIELGEVVAELDRYEGRLAGLAVVEVEFPDREAAERFVPPAWFGEELTGVAGWSNAALARSGARPE